MASSLGIWYGSWAFIGVTIVLAVLATLAVALRFWSRRLSGFGLHADDWLALATLLISHGLGATIVLAFLVDGLGFDVPILNVRDLNMRDPRAAMELQKLTFIGAILYSAGATSIRLSVIIFYFRIFPTRLVRRGGYILATVCLLWFVSTEGLNLGRCKPIAFMWNRSIPGGKCIDAPAAFIVPGAFNVVIDAATVALPIREVLRLNMSKEKKLVVFGVFLIGGIATAASFARLVAIVLFIDPKTIASNGAPFALLSATTGFEVYIAIIGACAPTLAPAYKRLRGRPTPSDTPIPHRSGYTTRPSKRRKNMKKKKHQQSLSSHTYVMGAANPALSRTALRESDDEERPFKRFDDVHVLVPPKERGELWTDISARPASEGAPLGGIRVQRDVTWNSEE